MNFILNNLAFLQLVDVKLKFIDKFQVKILGQLVFLGLFLFIYATNH